MITYILLAIILVAFLYYYYTTKPVEPEPKPTLILPPGIYKNVSQTTSEPPKESFESKNIQGREKSKYNVIEEKPMLNPKLMKL